MHGCYMFVTKTSVKEYLSDIERLALVFSGLCHDVSHRGYTNNFEILSYTKLAIRYHDKSVFFISLGLIINWIDSRFWSNTTQQPLSD